MLKFTMSALTLSENTAIDVMSDGQSSLQSSLPFQLSGNVELFATKISGSLGDVRVTFTTAKPPSVLAANLTLTDLVVDQPLVSADSLLTGGWQTL